MVFKITQFFILLFLSSASRAQSVSTLMGARSVSLGYACETLGDEWAIFNNVGGIGLARKATTSFAADVYSGMQGANRVALALSIPLKSGTAAAGIFHFGDEVYNEQLISAGYGNTMGITSLGAKINYIQYQADGFGTHGVFSFNAGGVARLTPSLTVGAFITNINQPAISKSSHEKLPTLLNAGLSFKASAKFLFVTGIQKDLDYIPTFKAGIEYEMNHSLIFRTGCNLHPDAVFFGFGLKRRKVIIDYALHQTEALSTGHQLSFCYVFTQRSVH